jgi:hypothetical protein|tara:strand:+ start:438 stop:953 length:516 start_codon:yes stop_codon:yes gene_type:complete
MGIKVEKIFKYCPPNWRTLDSEIELSFHLKGNDCVDGQLYQEFKEFDMDGVMKRLSNKYNWDIGLIYNLKHSNYYPRFTHFVEMPLKRKSQNPTLEKTDVVSKGYPWEEELNPTILQLCFDRVTRFSPPPPIIRMKVGGISFDEAMESWNICSIALRKMYQMHRNIWDMDK